jgi:hypothetical protein
LPEKSATMESPGNPQQVLHIVLFTNLPICWARML